MTITSGDGCQDANGAAKKKDEAREKYAANQDDDKTMQGNDTVAPVDLGIKREESTADGDSVSPTGVERKIDAGTTKTTTSKKV